MIKAISEMLGHADVVITLKIYHHVNARAIREMHIEHSPLRKLEAISVLAKSCRIASSHHCTKIGITVLL